MSPRCGQIKKLKEKQFAYQVHLKALLVAVELKHIIFHDHLYLSPLDHENVRNDDDIENSDDGFI